MKNVIITGIYGMLGSNVLCNIPKEYNVIGIDSNIRGMKKFSRAFTDYSRVKHVFEKDIREVTKEEIHPLLHSGEIIYLHLADIVGGIGYVFKNQASILAENSSIDVHSFGLAKELNSHLVVYPSTACVFNKKKQVSLESEVSIKNDLIPANPESLYGWSKIFGELYLTSLYETEQDKIKIFYLHNLIGFPCDFFSDKSQVLPSIINRALEAKQNGKKEIEIWGSGNQGRAFLPVDTAAKCIVRTLSSNEMPCKSQLGPNFCTSIKQLCQIVREHGFPSLKFKFDPNRPEGDMGRFPINKDVYFDLKITEKFLNTTIQETIKWVQKNKQQS